MKLVDGDDSGVHVMNIIPLSTAELVLMLPPSRSGVSFSLTRMVTEFVLTMLLPVMFYEHSSPLFHIICT